MAVFPPGPHPKTYPKADKPGIAYDHNGNFDHLGNNCSYPTYIAHKFYEYAAMAKMVYILATDEDARKELLKQLNEGFIGNALAARGHQITGDAYMQASMIDNFLYNVFGVDRPDNHEETQQAAMQSYEKAHEHAVVAVEHLEKYFAEAWKHFESRYTDCGIIYAVRTVQADGTFLVAEIAIGAGIGAGALKALRGLKVVASGLKGGKVTARVIAPNGKSISRTFTKEQLEADFGKPIENHVGGKTPDANKAPAPGKAPDPDVEPSKAPGSKAPRTNEELAPNGQVPFANEKGDFSKWWNDLTPEELDQLWANDKIQEKIADRVRSPGGLHEWLMTSKGPELKRLGFNMDEIKAMTTPTRKAEGPIPGGGRWRHTTDEGKTGTGSKKMHDELKSQIEAATSRSDLLRRLESFAEGWLDGGVNGFPPALRNVINSLP